MIMEIPKRHLARWYFMKQAGASNAGTIARFFSRYSAQFSVWVELYTLMSKRPLQRETNANLHDHLAAALIDEVCLSFGTEMGDVVNGYIYTYQKSDSVCAKDG